LLQVMGCCGPWEDDDDDVRERASSVIANYRGNCHVSGMMVMRVRTCAHHHPQQ
jgi:hypothetical protein